MRRAMSRFLQSNMRDRRVNDIPEDIYAAPEMGLRVGLRRADIGAVAGDTQRKRESSRTY